MIISSVPRFVVSYIMQSGFKKKGSYYVYSGSDENAAKREYSRASVGLARLMAKKKSSLDSAYISMQTVAGTNKNIILEKTITK